MAEPIHEPTFLSIMGKSLGPIIIIAIIIIGPKDFPIMLKKVGSWIGSAKRYVSNVQNEVSSLGNEDFSTDKKKEEKVENNDSK